MKLAKWGNSLAVRIPAEIAEKAGLRAGDEATFALTPDHVIEIRRDERRERAIQRLRELRIKVPYPYKFDRNEIYDS